MGGLPSLSDSRCNDQEHPWKSLSIPRRISERGIYSARRPAPVQATLCSPRPSTAASSSAITTGKISSWIFQEKSEPPTPKMAWERGLQSARRGGGIGRGGINSALRRRLRACRACRSAGELERANFQRLQGGELPAMKQRRPHQEERVQNLRRERHSRQPAQTPDDELEDHGRVSVRRLMCRITRKCTAWNTSRVHQSK